MSEQRQQRSWERLWIYPLLILLVLVVYHDQSKLGWTNWDDQNLVLRNGLIRNFDLSSIVYLFQIPKSGAYAPVRDFSYMVDMKIGGYSPVTFHLTNLLWYLIGVLLTYEFLRRLIPLRGAAFFGSVLFALYPIHVECVSWISARKDVLSYAFSLAFFLSGMAAAEKKTWSKTWIWLALAFLFLILAILSKPVAVVIPVMLVLILLYLRPKGPMMRHLPWIVLGFLVVAGGLLAYTVGYSGIQVASHPFWKTPWDMLKVVSGIWLQNLKLLFYPIHLIARYNNIYAADVNGLAVPAALLSLGLLALMIQWFRQRGWNWRLLLLGCLLGMIPLIPSNGLLTIAIQVADRYLYLASLAVAALVGWGFAVLWAHSAKIRIPGAIVWGAMSLFLGWQTWNLVPVWNDPVSLWENAEKYEPENNIVNWNLGHAYITDGRTDKALPYFRRGFFLLAQMEQGWGTMMRAYLDVGMPESTLAWGDRMHQYSADFFPEDEVLIAQAYMAMGRWDDGVAHCRMILEKAPYASHAHSMMAIGLWKLDHRTEALAHWYEALRINPNEAHALINLAVALSQTGDRSGAILLLERYLTQTPQWNWDEGVVRAYQSLLAAGPPAGPGK